MYRQLATLRARSRRELDAPLQLIPNLFLGDAALLRPHTRPGGEKGRQKLSVSVSVAGGPCRGALHRLIRSGERERSPGRRDIDASLLQIPLGGPVCPVRQPL